MSFNGAAPKRGTGAGPGYGLKGSHFSPYLRACLMASAIVVFLLVVPDFASLRDRVIAVLVSGALVWLATYSMERARPHLKDEWTQKDRDRPLSMRYSFWPGDYKNAGRYWAIGGLGFLVLWFLSLIAVLLRAVL